MFWGAFSYFKLTLLILSFSHLSYGDIPTGNDARLQPAPPEPVQNVGEHGNTPEAAAKEQQLKKEGVGEHDKQMGQGHHPADICQGTGKKTQEKTQNIPGGIMLIKEECCGNGTHCKSLDIESQLKKMEEQQAEAQAKKDACAKDAFCDTTEFKDVTGATQYDPFKAFMSPTAGGISNEALSEQFGPHQSGDQVSETPEQYTSELQPSVAYERIEPAQRAGGYGSPRPIVSDDTGSTRAATVADKKYQDSTSERVADERENQAAAQQAEQERIARANLQLQQQQAALKGAEGTEYERLKAQIASANQQAIANNEACNAAMANTNSACDRANEVTVSLPNSTSGGRNAMLIAESQCQKAAGVFQGAANRCQSAISSCNLACAPAGRSCAVFSAYSTSALLKMDSANHCQARSRIAIDAMDGKNGQGAGNSSNVAEKDKNNKKSKDDEDDDNSNNKGGPAQSNLIASDTKGEPGTAVKTASSEKDLKSQTKKIGTGGVEEGGIIKTASPSPEKKKKEKKSKLAGGDESGDRNKGKVKATSAGVSAKDLIDKLQKRSLASKSKIDDGIDRNANHDIFFGASRGHFIWQERHAHMTTPSTPTFFFKEHMMMLIENGWHDE